MCEYCKNMQNSDNVDPMILNNVCIGEIMGRKISVLLGMNCYKHGEYGRYQIYSELDVQSAYLDAVTSINIHYCPMCGRKLTEE